MLMLTHNLPQAAPDTVANYCASNATRSNEANTRRAGILHGRYAEH